MKKITTFLIFSSFILSIFSFSNVQAIEDDRSIVSVMGDSLSTYNGYTRGMKYYSFYSPEHMSVSQTWWMKYINDHSMRLGVCEALGGSKVGWYQGDPSGYDATKCMASQERFDALDDNGTPDVILFFGGTNDIGGTPLGNFTPGQNIGDVGTFYNAYQTAIYRMKTSYPNAKIISITPYYRKETWGPQWQVDAYADAIKTVCQYYGVECYDLRNANIDKTRDMCSADYLHVNISGNEKITYYMENGYAKLDATDIDFTNINGLINASYNAGGNSQTLYEFMVYDCSKAKWIWSSGCQSSNQISYSVPNSGWYWIYALAKNPNGDQINHVSAFYVQPQTLNSIGYSFNSTYIQLNVQGTGINSQNKFKWQVYNISEQRWSTLSSTSSSVQWQPNKGSYLINCELLNSNSEKISSKLIGFNVEHSYPAYIDGKYEGPNPYGRGVLLGVSSNVNPNQGYYYEILLLDCQKYLNGNPKPWVYGTGLKKVSSGRHLWATYAPNENGYYWTYYRLYNESGQLIDDHCYGAFLTK